LIYDDILFGDGFYFLVAILESLDNCEISLLPNQDLLLKLGILILMLLAFNYHRPQIILTRIWWRYWYSLDRLDRLDRLNRPDRLDILRRKSNDLYGLGLYWWFLRLLIVEMNKSLIRTTWASWRGGTIYLLHPR